MVARRDDFPKTIIKQTRELPLPETIDEGVQRRLDRLVEQVLLSKKQLSAAKSDKDKDFYGNKCAALDRQIDAIVYEFYSLNAQEIRLVEGAKA